MCGVIASEEELIDGKEGVLVTWLCAASQAGMIFKPAKGHVIGGYTSWLNQHATTLKPKTVTLLTSGNWAIGSVSGKRGCRSAHSYSRNNYGFVTLDS